MRSWSVFVPLLVLSFAKPAAALCPVINGGALAYRTVDAQAVCSAPPHDHVYTCQAYWVTDCNGNPKSGNAWARNIASPELGNCVECGSVHVNCTATSQQVPMGDCQTLMGDNTCNPRYHDPGCQPGSEFANVLAATGTVALRPVADATVGTGRDRINFGRSYLSSRAQDSRGEELGVGWSHSFGDHLTVGMHAAAWSRDDGGKVVFHGECSNHASAICDYSSPPLIDDHLRLRNGAVFELTLGDGTERRIFDVSGRLRSIERPDGEGDWEVAFELDYYDLPRGQSADCVVDNAEAIGIDKLCKITAVRADDTFMRLQYARQSVDACRTHDVLARLLGPDGKSLRRYEYGAISPACEETCSSECAETHLTESLPASGGDQIQRYSYDLSNPLSPLLNLSRMADGHSSFFDYSVDRSECTNDADCPIGSCDDGECAGPRRALRSRTDCDHDGGHCAADFSFEFRPGGTKVSNSIDGATWKTSFAFFRPVEIVSPAQVRTTYEWEPPGTRQRLLAETIVGADGSRRLRTYGYDADANRISMIVDGDDDVLASNGGPAGSMVYHFGIGRETNPVVELADGTRVDPRFGSGAAMAPRGGDAERPRTVTRVFDRLWAKLRTWLG